ncbi:MAG: hypothetical protein AAF197_03320 [Pseudomonadota bacterium]
MLRKALIISAFVFASQTSQAEPILGLHLFAIDGESKYTHLVTDPLVLMIGIENQSARAIAAQNYSNEIALLELEEAASFQEMPQEQREALTSYYQVESIPVARFDSNSSWIEDITFEVRDAEGESVDLGLRLSMEAAQQVKPPMLDENNGVLLSVTADQTALLRSVSGKYEVVAVFRERSFSKPFELELISDAPAPDWRNSEAQMLIKTTHLLNDFDFTAAAELADVWAQLSPTSINAWIALGDAQVGLNDEAAAISAYEEAERQFRSSYGDTPPEIPHELVNKLSQLRRAQAPLLIVDAPASTAEQ